MRQLGPLGLSPTIDRFIPYENELEPDHFSPIVVPSFLFLLGLAIFEVFAPIKSP